MTGLQIAWSGFVLLGALGLFLALLYIVFMCYCALMTMFMEGRLSQGFISKMRLRYQAFRKRRSART